MHQKSLAVFLPQESKYGVCPAQYLLHFLLFWPTFFTSSCILRTDSAALAALRSSRLLAAALAAMSLALTCPVSENFPKIDHNPWFAGGTLLSCNRLVTESLQPGS